MYGEDLIERFNLIDQLEMVWNIVFFNGQSNLAVVYKIKVKEYESMRESCNRIKYTFTFATE